MCFHRAGYYPHTPQDSFVAEPKAADMSRDNPAADPLFNQQNLFAFDTAALLPLRIQAH
jgi:hypothetical protein